MARCLWCELEQKTSRRLRHGEARECPECDHVFKGSGWNGIDTHWKARHDREVMPYEGFWDGIADCLKHYR